MRSGDNVGESPLLLESKTIIIYLKKQHWACYDEVYLPHRQYGQYRQTNRLIDRYKYGKTDTMKTKLKEKIKK